MSVYLTALYGDLYFQVYLRDIEDVDGEFSTEFLEVSYRMILKNDSQVVPNPLSSCYSQRATEALILR
jgi:hypothetical protein